MHTEQQCMQNRETAMAGAGLTESSIHPEEISDHRSLSQPAHWPALNCHHKNNTQITSNTHTQLVPTFK